MYKSYLDARCENTESLIVQLKVWNYGDKYAHMHKTELPYILNDNLIEIYDGYLDNKKFLPHEVLLINLIAVKENVKNNTLFLHLPEKYVLPICGIKNEKLKEVLNQIKRIVPEVREVKIIKDSSVIIENIN